MDTNQILMDVLPQGGFAAFLFWLYFTQKKDTQKLREEHKLEQADLRARYAKVISDYQLERDEAQKEVRKQITSLSDRIMQLETKLIQTLTRLEAFAETLSDLKNKIDR